MRRGTVDGYRIFSVTAGATVAISGLSAVEGSESNGGAIRNDGSLSLNQVVVQDSVATPVGRGGGIYNTGSLTILASTISNNFSDTYGSPYVGQGGGIYNIGELTIIETTLISNHTRGISSYGGAIHNGSSGGLTVIDSRISSNFAYPLGHGGGIWNTGSVSIYNSTINDNDADVYGGGVFSADGVLVLLNSTVHGNQAGDTGGGVMGGDPLTIISHSTISGNESDSESLGGGGLHTGNGPVFMRNTVIAGNTNGDVMGSLAGSDYNLIANSGGGTGFGPNDILDVDPLLGPLADNGGPTLTTALLPGSPAIDAGDNTDAPEFDQRGPGFPRIVNGTIDIGAFEVQSSPIPTPNRTSIDLLALVLATADLDSLT